jgi:hypothetical protein
MLIDAARAGDLENLTIWARQGVRVVTILPLLIATGKGNLEVLRWLVQELGADVDQEYRETTPLIDAADRGNLAIARCL